VMHGNISNLDMLYGTDDEQGSTDGLVRVILNIERYEYQAHVMRI
jgi:hypothetical protein